MCVFWSEGGALKNDMLEKRANNGICVLQHLELKEVLSVWSLHQNGFLHFGDSGRKCQNSNGPDDRPWK